VPTLIRQHTFYLNSLQRVISVPGCADTSSIPRLIASDPITQQISYEAQDREFTVFSSNRQL